MNVTSCETMELCFFIWVLVVFCWRLLWWRVGESLACVFAWIFRRNAFSCLSWLGKVNFLNPFSLHFSFISPLASFCLSCLTLIYFNRSFRERSSITCFMYSFTSIFCSRGSCILQLSKFWSSWVLRIQGSIKLLDIEFRVSQNFLNKKLYTGLTSRILGVWIS